jgi:cytochrome c553
MHSSSLTTKSPKKPQVTRAKGGGYDASVLGGNGDGCDRHSASSACASAGPDFFLSGHCRLISRVGLPLGAGFQGRAGRWRAATCAGLDGELHHCPGTGGPENASLAGLPAAYIIQQIEDYKSGARKFAGPQRSPSVLMTAIAKAVTLEEAQAAAAYFSALKPKANIKVIETDTVPITEIARVFYVVSKNRGSEPIGQRILEVPDDPAQFEHRDTRSQFTAYVPKGSIARGEALAKEGAGVTTACITCHGPDLKGVASVPGIAGRSPSYLVRQLYDFQQHARGGNMSALMAGVVEKLSQDDMIALAAYASSLKP